MASPTRRTYRSTLRTAQASQTRHAIVSAASRLFARDGFGATTIDSVAKEAGVSRKTVFTAVGGKIELLKIALDWAIGGDAEPVAVADRAPVSRLMHQDDPVALVHGWAKVLAEIDHRVAALVRAMENAASLDPAARKLYDQAQAQRLQGARSVVNRLAELNALTGAITPDEAADIAWLFADPTLYDRLVRLRGWPLERFAEWLGDSLCRELLAQPKNAAASS